MSVDSITIEHLMSVLQPGVENAITMADIQHRMGLPPQNTSERARALVKAAIEEHNYLICTGPQGVWLPEPKADVDAYVASLQIRIRGIQNRITALRAGLLIRSDFC